MKNIALIFGGKSVEHDISIITAMQTLNGLSKEHNILLVYITSEGKMITASNLHDEKVFLNFEQSKYDKWAIRAHLDRRPKYRHCEIFRQPLY